MTQYHFRQYLGLTPPAVRVLHAAIDPERFMAYDRPSCRIRERHAWGTTNSEVIGLFVGMNYRLKGLAPLLHALPHVPASCGFKLVVIGSQKFSRYASLARRLGVSDRVHFVGFRADPRDAYFAADFLVHPTFYDPCSLVALEALACGLPVLTSQYNGAKELLPADVPTIDDPHDARALAAAITEMCDPAKLAERRTAAADSGRRWTFEDHYRQLLHVFEEVVARKRGVTVTV